MTSPNAFALSDRCVVVVDLIGDLDATLASTFADTMRSLVADGATQIFVNARHAATASFDGLTTLDAACVTARDAGTTVTLDPGNRRMRAAFASASLAVEKRLGTAPHPRGTRHFMIARHADPRDLARTA